MIMIGSNFIFNFTNFGVIVSCFFLTKLLTLGDLFSTAARALVINISYFVFNLVHFIIKSSSSSYISNASYLVLNLIYFSTKSSSSS